MNNSPLIICYNFLLRTKGWDSTIGQSATKQVTEILQKLKKSSKSTFFSDLPSNWYLPLLISLQNPHSATVEIVLNAFSDLYCKKLLNFTFTQSNENEDDLQQSKNEMSNHILVLIINCISQFSKEFYIHSAISITRFALGVINGEFDVNSPVHSEVLLQYFQAIYNCALFANDKTAQVSCRTSLTQCVEIIAQRFESPPIYPTEISLFAYQIVKKAAFNVMASDIFDLLDNTTNITSPSNIYETDALLILRTICTFSSSQTLGSIISPNSTLLSPSTFLSDFSSSNTSLINTKALISIELASNFISHDHEIMYTSFNYLQIIKNFVCSLVLRHSHSESHRVFKATIKLCHILMMRYRDILKAESSVFFSSLFFRILDNESSSQLDKIAVIDQLERFSPSFLAEIFVNFDCDIDLQEANVFEHIINSLIQLSEYPESLQVIATILKKLNNWSSQKNTSMKPTPTTSKIEKSKKTESHVFKSDR